MYRRWCGLRDDVAHTGTYSSINPLYSGNVMLTGRLGKMKARRFFLLLGVILDY